MKRILLTILLSMSYLAISAKPVSPDQPPVPAATTTNQTVATLAASSQNINPQVLKLALDAYNCAVLSGQSKQKVLTIVDYSKPSTEKRMWIFDLAQNKLLFNSLVAHGKGSGEVSPDRFSNLAETHQSSIGLFVTGDVYSGHNGSSLRLHGMEKNFNDKAESRSIVVHGADYVNETLAKAGRIGRSWGCPAVPRKLAQPIIDTIKGGSVVVAYYPDKKWLENSTYLHCSGNLNNSSSLT